MRMGSLDGRVAIITGAGRGLGRSTRCCSPPRVPRSSSTTPAAPTTAAGVEETPAEEVVAEIRAAGGEAVANGDDVADWEGARRLVETAIDAFGGLDILVNNAGILRDRVLVNMTEAEWDDVVRVHLKGHFCPTRWAAAYWRDEHKAGRRPRATSSTRRRRRVCSPTPGRATTARPSRASPRSRQIARQGTGPLRRQEQLHRPGGAHPADPGDARPRRDHGRPRTACSTSGTRRTFAPVVAYLASAACPFNGETFFVQGGTVQRVRSWEIAETVRCDGAWSVGELTAAATSWRPSTATSE